MENKTLANDNFSEKTSKFSAFGGLNVPVPTLYNNVFSPSRLGRNFLRRTRRRISQFARFAAEVAEASFFGKEPPVLDAKNDHYPVHYINPTVDLSKIKHVAFDMDGTIYKGGTLFEFTPGVFKTLEEIGIGYTYLTNNSSKSAKDYLKKILSLNLKATPDNVSTSATATYFFLRKNYPNVKKVYVLGTASLREEFAEQGYTLIDEYNEKDEPDLVVVAFDTTLTYDRLCKATYWIGKGKPYIATHPDTVCPTDQETILVDCGAVQALIENVTGRKPEAVPGKPDPATIGGVMDKYGLEPDEIMMVGDRIYTDLEMARRAKIPGVLVLTGEATLETLKEAGWTPELVLDDISVLADLLVEAKTKKK